MKELIESFKYILDIGGKYVLEIITVEASKLYKNKYLRQNYKKVGKYALMKRFHYYRWLQVYIYAFVFIDPETTTKEY